MSLNQCQFIGNLTRDPETRHTQGGTKVVNFSIAVNQKRGDQEETLFVNVTAWGSKTSDGVAGVVERFLKKGSKVFISGSMRTSQYEKDGVTHRNTEIHIGGPSSQLVMLSSKQDSQGEGYTPSQNPAPATELDDEIPF